MDEKNHNNSSYKYGYLKGLLTGIAGTSIVAAGIFYYAYNNYANKVTIKPFKNVNLEFVVDKK